MRHACAHDPCVVLCEHVHCYCLFVHDVCRVSARCGCVLRAASPPPPQSPHVGPVLPHGGGGGVAAGRARGAVSSPGHGLPPLRRRPVAAGGNAAVQPGRGACARHVAYSLGSLSCTRSCVCWGSPRLLYFAPTLPCATGSLVVRRESGDDAWTHNLVACLRRRCTAPAPQWCLCAPAQMESVLKRATAAAWDLADSCALAAARAASTQVPLWENHFNYGTLLLRRVRGAAWAVCSPHPPPTPRLACFSTCSARRAVGPSLCPPPPPPVNECQENSLPLCAACSLCTALLCVCHAVAATHRSTSTRRCST